MILAFIIVNNYGRARHLKFYKDTVRRRAKQNTGRDATHNPTASLRSAACLSLAGARPVTTRVR
eukprot:4776019-Prymnesium_polylepis.1